MYIGAPLGCLGLRGAAARRSATWPFALVGLRATSQTCDSLCEIAQKVPFGINLTIYKTCMYITFTRLNI
jgi:hypothetical protein